MIWLHEPPHGLPAWSACMGSVQETVGVTCRRDRPGDLVDADDVARA
jgi:hypothetical protein